MPDVKKPETTGAVPNLVTHVASAQGHVEEALTAVVAAMERELHNGRQFYTLPIGQTWGVFYNGESRVH